MTSLFWISNLGLTSYLPTMVGSCFRSPALLFSYSWRHHLTSLCFSMVAYSFCERSLDTLGMPGFFLLPLLRLLLFLLVFLLFFFLAFLLSPFVTCRIAERRQENVNVLLGSDWNNGKKDSFLWNEIILCLPPNALYSVFKLLFTVNIFFHETLHYGNLSFWPGEPHSLETLQIQQSSLRFENRKQVATHSVGQWRVHGSGEPRTWTHCLILTF